MATRGFENVTAADVAKMGRVEAAVAKAGRSKYGSVKTTVDGIAFDSAKESRRYQELLNLTKAGRVRRLRVQPRYTLCALSVTGADPRDVNAGTIDGRRVPVCEYVADFEFEESYLGQVWNVVVEDVKSIATRRKEVYRLKRKLFEAQYGIQIRET